MEVYSLYQQLWAFLLLLGARRRPSQGFTSVFLFLFSWTLLGYKA